MNYRVGIVEDNESARGQLRTYLQEYGQMRDCGFSVTDFADALNFLEEFRGNYDLIFMDIGAACASPRSSMWRYRTTKSSIIR